MSLLKHALLGSALALTLGVAGGGVAQAEPNLGFNSNGTFGTTYYKGITKSDNPVQEIGTFYNQVGSSQEFSQEFPTELGTKVVNTRIEATAINSGQYEVQSNNQSESIQREIGVQYDFDFGISAGW